MYVLLCAFGNTSNGQKTGTSWELIGNLDSTPIESGNSCSKTQEVSFSGRWKNLIVPYWLFFFNFE